MVYHGGSQRAFCKAESWQSPMETRFPQDKPELVNPCGFTMRL